MGKLLEFDIILTNNKVVYSPGESISGIVKIVVVQPLQYKTIKVNCLGLCGVSNHINDTSWSLEEQYFSSTLSVADKGILKQGEHTFPFQFLIPASSPVSFDGAYGKIAYRVRVTIDTSRFSKDYQTQKLFQMVKHLNLNEVPGIERPSSSVATKTFTYLLVKTGTIVLEAKTNLRGYIPGQVISLTVQVHNDSGRDTGRLRASLIQIVTYKTKQPIHDKRQIAEVVGAGIKAGKHGEWKEQIIVPAIPQSGIAGCSLIVVDYVIQVCLKSPEVLVTLPIYIGSIPVDMTVSPNPTRPAPPAPTPRSAPGTAPRPVPRPRTRIQEVAPSAPPAPMEAEEPVPMAAGPNSAYTPAKSHSQHDSSGALRHTQHSHGASNTSNPLFCVSMGATVPDSGGNPTPGPNTSTLSLQPPCGIWAYPPGPPPTYEESCRQ